MDTSEDLESFKAKTIIRLDALQDWIEVLTENLNDMGRVFTEIHTKDLRYNPSTELQTKAKAACGTKSDESKPKSESESKPKVVRKAKVKKSVADSIPLDESKPTLVLDTSQANIPVKLKNSKERIKGIKDQNASRPDLILIDGELI